MNKRELRHLEFAKKHLLVQEGSEMSKKVAELEDIISQQMDMWSDPDIYYKYKKVRELPIEERRLVIVYSLLGGSVNKTATFFQVDRKTITNRLTPIIEKIRL